MLQKLLCNIVEIESCTNSGINQLLSAKRLCTAPARLHHCRSCSRPTLPINVNPFVNMHHFKNLRQAIWVFEKVVSNLVRSRTQDLNGNFEACELFLQK
jgi:hypothetical protein